MNLVAILIAMATEGFWKSFAALRHYRAIQTLAIRLQARAKGAAWFAGPAGVLLTIAPGAILTALVQYLLGINAGLLSWLLMLVFSVTVLVFSIGVRGFAQHVDDYVTALNRGDSEGAFLCVKDIVRDVPIGSPGELNRRLLEVMLIRNNERLLAILFWFVLLGPLGAVLYRSTTQLKGFAHDKGAMPDAYLEAVFRLQAILDWLPARMTAVFYAIIGSFVDAIHNWREHGAEWRGDLYAGNRGILVTSGLGALQLDPSALDAETDHEVLVRHVGDVHALVGRTVIAWLTIFALLTIAGWLS